MSTLAGPPAAELVDDPGFAIDETLRLYPPAWIGPKHGLPVRVRAARGA